MNLKGLTVLTEAASGNFIWGPVIAAKAGAKVIAFTKDSRFGYARDIKSDTLNLAEKFKLSENIKIVTKLDGKLIKSADIITNSGFLRPLDKKKLRFFKKGAVIPLMWETWEFRENDLDLAFCYKNNIPVLGTNESNLYLNTISYLGPVVKKLLFEKNIEVYNSQIGIVGAGKFANAIEKSLKSEGAYCFKVSAFTNRDKNFLDSCDALVFADHETDNLYIGAEGKITGKELKKINSDLLIVHISGNIDANDLKANGIDYCPEIIAPPHYMSAATDYAGPRPLIDLFTAGLKVAEILSAAAKRNSGYDNIISAALNNKLCQDFSKEQKRIYFS